MAEGQRMTAAEVVEKVLRFEHADFLREAVALIARELMEAEISAEIGAELREVAPETRTTHRNGYRPRPWRPGWARSSCSFRRSEPAPPTSPPSSSRAGEASRRSWRW
jgi:hypothetical protein